MRSILIAAVFSLFAASTSVGGALAAPGGIPGPPPGHGKAPAPEIGGSIIGLAMAGGIALYVLRRRRNAQV